MGIKDKFSEKLDSFELQAAKGGCLEDWNDYFYMTVRDFFANCEDEKKRATIAGFKREIVQMAMSDPFNFK